MAALGMVSQRVQAEAICAEVKIEIQQTVSLERQAFNARLGINNGVALPISGLDVDIEFRDAAGNTVIGSFDPDNTSAVFFIREDGSTGVTGGSNGNGSVPGSSDAELNWLIIPSPGAGGTVAQGQLYAVGARVSYTQGGQSRSVNVQPDTITVRPQPQLTLDYFLTRDVLADDPFTTTIEPPVPFFLGVRVRNVGAGPAQHMQIESAQPRIVENQQGLAIQFSILDAIVGNDPAQASLLMAFGDIAPGASKVGRWRMATTLSGRFVEFGADFTHADELGGALTSLIQSVQAHDLLQVVRNDAAGRDLLIDYLAIDGDTLRSYESDGIDTVVIDRSAKATINPTGPATYIVDAPASVLPLYLKLPAPTGDRFNIASAIRLGPGGGSMPAENVWLSKVRRQPGGSSFDYFVNLYDGRGHGRYEVATIRDDLGQLSGEVYRDLDDDGVRDVGEPAIEAVPVVLVGAQTTANTTTDSTGQFRFQQLLADTYSLSVGAMVGLRDGTHSAGSLGGTVMTSAITGISLPTNQQGSSYRFAKVSTSALPQADLQLLPVTVPNELLVGQAFDLSFQVRNAGPDPAGATLTFTVPASLIVVSATPGVGLWNAGSNQWQVGQLPIQGDATLTLRLRADTVGTRLLRSVLSSDRTDPVSGNNQQELALSIGEAGSGLIFRDGFENLVREPK